MSVVTLDQLREQLKHQDVKLIDIWGRFQGADVGSIAEIERAVGAMLEEMRVMNKLLRETVDHVAAVSAA